MPEKISHQSLAIMIGNLDKKIDKNDKHLNEKVDNMAETQVIQNGRTFKNSTDIAKMKGQSGVIAFFVSLITSIVGIYFGTRK